MKILAGIPTRLRNTSGKIADVLAEVCDEVLVVSQGADVICNSRKVSIEEKDVNYGLVNARNYILEYANIHGYDLVLQSDDDLAYKPETVEAMVNTLLKYPTLGAIASSSRAYFNWDKGLEPTREFVLSPCSPQLWVATVKVLNEVGPWKLEYLEDREHGARMWKLGYAIGTLHLDLKLAHNPFLARTSTSDEGGGQDKGRERYDRLGVAIAYMNAVHGDIVKIRQSEYGAKNRTFSSRYDWSKLLSYPISRFGYVLGYEDSRGRQL